MHFLYLSIAGSLGLLTLLFAELGHRRGWLMGEVARKFVHVLISLQVAVWPLYLSWDEIRLISIVLTIGFVICLQLRLFQSVRSVSRLTYGEVLFTLIIGALTLVTQSEAIYAAAILHLGLADGLAAIIGIRYGKKTRYKVFGHTKSAVGTATFLVTSIFILSAYSILSNAGLPWEFIVIGALGASVFENIGVYGSDNLLVPGYVIWLLSYASSYYSRLV